MDSQVEGTEGHRVAEAAWSHVLPELASRDSDVEASSSSSISDENVLERAAVGASNFTESAMPSLSMQVVVIATTHPPSTTTRVSSSAASHGVAGSSCPSIDYATIAEVLKQLLNRNYRLLEFLPNSNTRLQSFHR